METAPTKREFFSSVSEAVELCTRIFSDPLPQVVDAAYLFGCHVKNEVSVLTRGYDLYRAQGITRVLAILERDEYWVDGKYVGYSGSKKWSRVLSRWVCSSIVMTKLEDDNVFNTYTESLALIRRAKELGWQSVIVVAFPAHMLRAFTSAVSAAKVLGWPGRLYASAGIPLPWAEETAHSHGTGVITRQAAIALEHGCLDTYGNLLLARDVLAYLNARDGVKA